MRVIVNLPENNYGALVLTDIVEGIINYTFFFSQSIYVGKESYYVHYSANDCENVGEAIGRLVGSVLSDRIVNNYHPVPFIKD